MKARIFEISTILLRICAIVTAIVFIIIAFIQLSKGEYIDFVLILLLAAINVGIFFIFGSNKS